MTEYSLLVPTTDNDGTPIDPEVIADIHRLMIDTAGGYTDLGEVTGSWQDPETGEVITERNRRILIATRSPRDARRLAEQIGAMTHQKAVYLARTGQAEIIPIAA